MKLRSSRVLRRVTPRVDLQYHIDIPDPHDLDQPCYTLLGLHTTPGDKFYNANPIVWTNPGSSKESSTEPMDTDEAQQITDRLTQVIWNSRGLCRSGSLGNIPWPLPAAAYFLHPTDRSVASIKSSYPKSGCSCIRRNYCSSNTNWYSDPNARGRC